MAYPIFNAPIDQYIIIEMRKMWLNDAVNRFISIQLVCASAIVTFVFAQSMPIKRNRNENKGNNGPFKEGKKR